jgi:transcriptional regulator with XRE-family HTH domain
LSTRGFAEYLGVAKRTVAKWESGAANVNPRPESQAILDIALSRASPDAKRVSLLSWILLSRADSRLRAAAIPVCTTPDDLSLDALLSSQSDTAALMSYLTYADLVLSRRQAARAVLGMAFE